MPSSVIIDERTTNGAVCDLYRCCQHVHAHEALTAAKTILGVLGISSPANPINRLRLKGFRVYQGGTGEVAEWSKARPC
jgi:hypothetical protein